MVKLSPELVRELERMGDQPLPVEIPNSKRVYVLVDIEKYDVVRRPTVPCSAAKTWTENKNERRCALIRKKFSQGIDAEETCELNQLQDELSEYRKHLVRLPYDVVDELQAAVTSAPISPRAPLT
jgi:hypothetical protein